MTLYERNPRVIRRQVGGETVLVPLAGADAANLEFIYRLNPTAAAIWDTLETPRAERDLVDELLRRFEGAEGVENDLRAFLADMLDAGLIRANSEPS